MARAFIQIGKYRRSVAVSCTACRSLRIREQCINSYVINTVSEFRSCLRLYTLLILLPPPERLDESEPSRLRPRLRLSLLCLPTQPQQRHDARPPVCALERER